MSGRENADHKFGWLGDNAIVFDGNYSRDGFAAVQRDNCVGCGAQQVPCLFVDQSEGEYSPATICRSCVNKLFDNIAESSL